MVTYTLFAAPNTYALSAHAVLEEVQADYKLRWIEIFSEAPDPDFAAVSPHRRTPALVGPSGSMVETGAIALYLAELFPESRLLVPQGHRERGPFLQWIHYLATTLQPDVILLYHPEFYMASERERGRLRDAATRRLVGVYEVLDRALNSTQGPWFFPGVGPTVPDILLAMQTVWDEIFPTGIKAFPALERQRMTYLDRPAAKRVLSAHRAESARRKAGR